MTAGGDGRTGASVVFGKQDNSQQTIKKTKQDSTTFSDGLLSKSGRITARQSVIEIIFMCYVLVLQLIF